MASKRTVNIEGLSWLGIGIMISALGWRIGLGSFQEPGSGFVAFISGLSVSVLALIMIFSRIYSRVTQTTAAFSVRAFRRVPVAPLIITIGVLVGYGLFLDTLGYSVTTLFVMWALFYLFREKGKNRLFLSFLASLLTTGITYMVFEVWLRSQLPRGIFPWW